MEDYQRINKYDCMSNAILNPIKNDMENKMKMKIRLNVKLYTEHEYVIGFTI